MEPPRCPLTCYTFKKHSQAVGCESLVVQALLPGPDTFRSHLTQADFQSTACKDAEGGWRLEASLGLPGLTQALPGPRRLQECSESALQPFARVVGNFAAKKGQRGLANMACFVCLKTTVYFGLQQWCPVTGQRGFS